MAEADRDLIRACRRGDSGAWKRLLKKYERLIFSIPLRYGLSREDAADILQATFTTLIQSFDDLSEEGNLGAWLATVAHRRTWRLLERGRREAEYVRDLIEGAPPGEEHPAERWELTEWLKGGLSQLDDSCRNLLLMLYFRPSSYAEVAERLSMPLGSIGPTRARCLKRMRRILEEGR